MAKIIYKENCKRKNIIDCIDGIEIELLNSQKALIYPKYSEKMLLPTYKIVSWNTEEISEIDALKKESSHLATEELLRCGSPAAEHVSNFHSDKYGIFNLPTLLAAMEIQSQKEDIDAMAKTIKGTDLLHDFISCVWSCSRHHKDTGWLASGDYGSASSYYLYARHLAIPVVLYR